MHIIKKLHRKNWVKLLSIVLISYWFLRNNIRDTLAII
jgi:hypothetical protein